MLGSFLNLELKKAQCIVHLLCDLYMYIKDNPSQREYFYFIDDCTVNKNWNCNSIQIQVCLFLKTLC